MRLPVREKSAFVPLAGNDGQPRLLLGIAGQRVFSVFQRQQHSLFVLRGHTLGLGSHSADTNDLMNPLPRRLALSDRDRYTIQVLYHTTPTIGPPLR